MDERLAKAIEMLRQSVRHSAQGNETETIMNATYTRLTDGEWGLRANGPLVPGQQVTVTTRDGRVKTEIVGTIEWANNGITVATKARAAGGQRPFQAIQPVTPTAPPAPAVQPDALARIIIDLETALAGLKALQRAA